ncbi:MAG: flagellar basal body-associated FliL family protein [Pseudobdellovibrionaceae bacterium]
MAEHEEAPHDDKPVAAAGGHGEAESLDDDGGSKKKILFLLVALILLTAIGTGLYFSGMLDSVMGKTDEATEETAGGEHGDAPAAEHGAASSGGGEHGEGVPGIAFLPIPDMLVNLSSDDGQPRYLRLSVQLELESEADRAAVEAVLPRVIDQFQTYLRELRVEDLRGSKGIYRLQIELLNRVNTAAYPVKVKDVLFQEILIQ